MSMYRFFKKSGVVREVLIIVSLATLWKMHFVGGWALVGLYLGSHVIEMIVGGFLMSRDPEATVELAEHLARKRAEREAKKIVGALFGEHQQARERANGLRARVFLGK